MLFAFYILLASVLSQWWSDLWVSIEFALCALISFFDNDDDDDENESLAEKNFCDKKTTENVSINWVSELLKTCKRIESDDAAAKNNAVD